MRNACSGPEYFRRIESCLVPATHASFGKADVKPRPAERAMILHRFENGDGLGRDVEEAVGRLSGLGVAPDVRELDPPTQFRWPVATLLGAVIPSARTSLAFSASPLARRAMLRTASNRLLSSAWEERRRALEQVDRSGHVSSLESANAGLAQAVATVLRESFGPPVELAELTSQLEGPLEVVADEFVEPQPDPQRSDRDGRRSARAAQLGVASVPSGRPPPGR